MVSSTKTRPRAAEETDEPETEAITNNANANQQAIEPTIRIAELEEMGVALIEAEAAKETARLKYTEAHTAVREALSRHGLPDYPMLDRPKTLVLRKSTKVVVTDRTITPN
jgi:hypothetical protein